MEKLPQTHVKTWKIWIQLPTSDLLSARRHEAAAEGVGEEGGQGAVDSEAPGPGEGRRNQSYQQVEPDTLSQTSHSTKICGKAKSDTSKDYFI